MISSRNASSPPEMLVKSWRSSDGCPPPKKLSSLIPVFPCTLVYQSLEFPRTGPDGWAPPARTIRTVGCSSINHVASSRRRPLWRPFSRPDPRLPAPGKTGSGVCGAGASPAPQTLFACLTGELIRLTLLGEACFPHTLRLCRPAAGRPRHCDNPAGDLIRRCAFDRRIRGTICLRKMRLDAFAQATIVDSPYEGPRARAWIFLVSGPCQTENGASRTFHS